MRNRQDNTQPFNGSYRPKGRFKRILVNFLVTIVFGFIYFYFELPALNLHNKDFYFFFFLLSAVYCGCAIITSGIWRTDDQAAFFRQVKSHCKIPLIICAAFLVLIAVGSLASSVILRAGSYSSLLTINTGNFTEDVQEVSYDQIPMLDRASAEKLGDRKLGELSDMVSQFEVSSQNSQLNYNDRPMRVTPLVYGDLIKWLNNRKNGIPAYVLIDMVTQNVEVVRLEEGMKYTTDEHFMRNLYRHLRFNYPTYMFDSPIFEIDDNGDPYWICPRVTMRIGLFGGRDIDGAVLVNAVNGESTYYPAADVPTWVDRVYTAELIMEQYDYYGQYSNGFLNSLLGQKGVTVTTDGYNYIAMDDDVYMYTGVTSVGGDQSNVGFILANQRTKETRYYQVAGAEEYSAMSSAQGVVQHLGYSATFPLLLNINSEPTYFMALKDAAGLVKMYAMVNVRQYQVVATGQTVIECQDNYRRLLLQNNITTESTAPTTEAIGIVIEKREAVLEGNTYYYFKLDTSDSYYAVSAADAALSVIVNVGDTVKINFVGDAGSEIVAGTDLERLSHSQAAPSTEPTVSTEPAENTANDESNSQAAA
ncbi:MAG: CvpA family protein [Oscillospiraceae bacterium]|nr:CvpA family protein [Oscillospiraceae bacterium]